MKQVLIIDESPHFREYIKTKLTGNGITAHTAVNGADGVAKLTTLVPDLIIMDYHLSRQGYTEVFTQKKTNPVTARIPMIILAQQMSQQKLIEMLPYNVVKVFNKPVKIDTFFKTLSQILGVQFAVDQSPGVVEVHVNDDIIFVEIAQGLNNDKLDILAVKMAELISLYQIQVPKVIIMFSDIKFSEEESPGLKKLLSMVLSVSAEKHHIKLLAMDAFVQNFVKINREYKGIEVSKNLQEAMDGLLDADSTESAVGIIETAAAASDGGLVELRFENDTRINIEGMTDVVRDLRIAVVDDDIVIQKLVKSIFERAGASVKAYSDGEEFVKALDHEEFDLVFLDLLMPKLDGFDVLRDLILRFYTRPVIVLSAVTERDSVVRVFQMGIKSYLTKPLKPDVIFKKALEILKVNF